MREVDTDFPSRSDNMQFYSAKVVDKAGRKLSITEEAISEQLFEDSLNQKGYYIIDIKEVSSKNVSFFSDNINKKFLQDFTYNIYSLLEFGIDINEVFKILAELFTSGKEAQLVKDAISYLKKGEKLSVALRNAEGSEIFDDFFISMVASGEHSGNLTDAFKLINSYVRNNQKIKDKLLSASFYPLILVVISIAAVNFLLFLIIPNFEKIYSSMDYQPSLLIQIALNISQFLQTHFVIYLISLFMLIFGLLIFFRTSASKKFLILLLDNLPIISKISKLQAKIKVSFSLEILLKGGASLEEALLKLSEIEKNPKLKKEYLKTLTMLKEGNSVRSAFKNLKIYNSRDLNIIEISDTTSRTDEGFKKIHLDATGQLEAFLDTLFTVIEPIIMVFIGLFIAFIMYLVVSPTLEMVGKTN
jgi:type II secretory pathway component PulF